MDEYYRILESLPPALRTPLAKLDAHYAPHIQEIRLRLGQPVQFTVCGRLCPAAKFLPGTGLPAALETDTLRDCFLQLCRRSVYAYEDELKEKTDRLNALNIELNLDEKDTPVLDSEPEQTEGQPERKIQTERDNRICTFVMLIFGKYNKGRIRKCRRCIRCLVRSDLKLL